MFEQKIECYGELSAVVIRADGSREDRGVIAGRREVLNPTLIHSPRWYQRLWAKLKSNGLIPASMSLGAFIAYEIGKHIGHTDPSLLQAVVTTSGVTYMASDFASGGVSPRISAFNFHDCGTGGAHGSTGTVTAATSATPIVISVATHGYTTNDIVTIAAVGGNTAANGTWQITVLSAGTFSLTGSVWSSGAYTSGGTSQLVNGAADTALTTPAGTSRVAGVQTNPTGVQYKSVATIPFTGTLSIVEWGIFSASSTGTMWDRRWFNSGASPATTAVAALTANAIGVNNGDSIQFAYTLTISAGGS